MYLVSGRGRLLSENGMGFLTQLFHPSAGSLPVPSSYTKPKAAGSAESSVSEVTCIIFAVVLIDQSLVAAISEDHVHLISHPLQRKDNHRPCINRIRMRVLPPTKVVK